MATASSPEAAPRQKNGDIEILRAFAILFTVVLHLRVLLPADSALLIPLGMLDLSVGVDLFLVISGFVITGSIIESTGVGGATRRQLMFSFWVKRIFRLLPAAWVWVIIALIARLLISIATDIHYDLRDIFISTAAALGNVMNFYTPHCLVNNGGQACVVDNYLGHYWSLSLEEQFYLVFPFLFFFINRKAMAVMLVAVIMAQFMWQRPFFTYAWYFKTDALCWGILLALLARTTFYQRHLPPALNHRYLAAAFGLALILLLPLLAANTQGIATMMKPYGVALVALVCATIVWLASYDSNLFSIGSRYRQTMLYLGSRSYSLYLCHLVIYLAIRDLFSQYGNGLLATMGPTGCSVVLIVIAGALTLLGAELTYRHVESTVRARGRAIAARLLAGDRRKRRPTLP